MPRNYSVKETIQRAKDKNKQKEIEENISIEEDIIEEDLIPEVLQTMPEQQIEEFIPTENTEEVVMDTKQENKKGFFKSLFSWFK